MGIVLVIWRGRRLGGEKEVRDGKEEVREGNEEVGDGKEEVKYEEEEVREGKEEVRENWIGRVADRKKIGNLNFIQSKQHEKKRKKRVSL